jgi:hypothetical protein
VTSRIARLEQLKGKKSFLGGVAGLLSMFRNLIEIRWIDLQFAKVQEWKGHVVKI